MRITVNGAEIEIKKDAYADGRPRLSAGETVITCQILGLASLIAGDDDAMISDGDVRAALLEARVIEQTGRTAKDIATLTPYPIVHLLF